MSVNSIQYGGERVEKSKEGKEVKIPIHPKHALQIRGPVIQVSITQPEKIAKKLIAEGKTVETIVVSALIDTGAASCIITDQIADKLGLIQSGFQNITSV